MHHVKQPGYPAVWRAPPVFTRPQVDSAQDLRPLVQVRRSRLVVWGTYADPCRLFAGTPYLLD